MSTNKRTESTMDYSSAGSDYISQLETENSFLRDTLLTLKATVNEVISENQRLYQNEKSSLKQLQNYFPHKYNGISDEEKGLTENIQSPDMLQRYLKSTERIFVEKIEQLQQELVQTRGHLMEKEMEISILKSHVMDNNPAVASTNTSSIDDLKATIARLKMDVTKMKDREHTAKQQVERSVLLVEQAQLEKLQVENVLSQVRDMADNQKSVWLTERERIERISKNKIQELSELLSSTKESLEKVNKERQNNESQLVKAKDESETYFSEIQNLTISYKKSMTSAGVEKSKALHEISRLKVSTDSVIKDYQMEIEKLHESNKKINHQYVKSKEESVAAQNNTRLLSQQFHNLQKELLEAKKTLADQISNKQIDVISVINIMQKNEDEFKKFIRELENKHVRVYTEAITIMESQRDLVTQMKAELGNAMQAMDTFLQFQCLSSKTFTKEKCALEKKMALCLQKCTQLEVMCHHKEKIYHDAQIQLNKFDELTQQSAKQIAALMLKNEVLLEERTILNKEVKFLQKNFHLLN